LFAVLALALLGTFALIFTTVDAERVQREQATRTSAVLAALDGIVAATLNGETGQRGYYITYDRRYLAPYEQGHAAYEAEMRALRQRLGRASIPAGRAGGRDRAPGRCQVGRNGRHGGTGAAWRTGRGAGAHAV
jgi:hypothetical protein